MKKSEALNLCAMFKSMNYEDRELALGLFVNYRVEELSTPILGVLYNGLQKIPSIKLNSDYLKSFMKLQFQIINLYKERLERQLTLLLPQKKCRKKYEFFYEELLKINKKIDVRRESSKY